jgi:ABC-type nickel/cobalt efflux system permease component RcnA
MGALFMLQIFPPQLGIMFYLLMGIGLGISLTMSVGAILNHRLIVRLQNLRGKKA